MMFVIRTGSYQFKVMQLGFMNKASTFQPMKDGVLKYFSFAQAYLDDVVVHSTTVDEHLVPLQKLFAVISGHRLKLKISKCEFSKNNAELLRHAVSSGGFSADLKNVVPTRDAPDPFKKASVQSFIEAFGLLPSFIKTSGIYRLFSILPHQKLQNSIEMPACKSFLMSWRWISVAHQYRHFRTLSSSSSLKQTHHR